MKKKTIITILILVLLCVTGGCYFGAKHVWLDGRILPTTVTEVTISGEKLPKIKTLERLDALELLDARKITLNAEQYEQLASALPGCHILWQVPIFGGYHDNIETEVVAASIQQPDITMLRYFPNLEKVDASACTDLAMVTALKAAWPELDVTYRAVLGDTELFQDTTELVFGGADASKLLAVIGYFPQLQKIDAAGCGDYATLDQIRRIYPELELVYSVQVGGRAWPYDIKTLTLQNADGEELQKVLPYFTVLQRVTLTGTVPDQETMYELMHAYPEVVFDWKFTVCGVETASTATELILSDIPMETVDAVESSLKYFYDLQRVEMCQCGISNEEMDALGKRHPETRFVWSFPFGKGYLRTDETALIPFKYGYPFDNPCTDEQTKLLKYCTDMVVLDLGHMQMKDLSFLQYMPKLKYLILGDTRAADYSPVGYLTELIYLEVFWSDFKESDVLLKLTKLEDLNCAWAKLDRPEALYQMTWLKRLWATSVGIPSSELYKLKEALPNTQVFVHGKHPTDGGWRQAQNYYDMRDLLGMHYMQ